ncbi:MAG: AMP-binding protein [Pseudomonadota bacterium]
MANTEGSYTTSVHEGILQSLLHDHSSLLRVVRSLVADEVSVSRGCSSLQQESLAWPTDAPLKEGGIGLDSLEMNDVAARLSQFFRMYEVGIEDYLLLDPTLESLTEVVAQSLSIKGEQLTFLTSGSTGVPKPCDQELADIQRDATFINDLVEPQRVISLVPPHHIYGFIYSVLLPLYRECPVVDVRYWSPGKLRACLCPGDLVVGTPYLFKNFVRFLGRVPKGLTALCSTSPLSPGTLQQMQSADFEMIYNIYGSSETGGIGWRLEPNSEFHIFPWLSIHKDESSEYGDAVLHSHNTNGAIHQPLMDRIRLSEDRLQFEVLGRRDSAVQIGGENVFPSTIEAIINALPFVSSCAVRPTNASDGATNRLEAIVTGNGQLSPGALEIALYQHCRENMTERMRPARIIIRDHVMLNDMGKAVSA